MRKKTIHNKFCKAGLVLVLAGTIGTYGVDALAEELGKSTDVTENAVPVNDKGNKKVELRDQTFTLGRLRIDQGTVYDYRETIPESGIVGEILTVSDVERPLGEDYQGYVEIKGRIKSGDTVWLEVSVDGKPAGYITQGSLEVKPVTRTKNVGIPEGLNTRQVTTKGITLYDNLTFLDTKEEVIPENTEMTILGVYDVVFYNKPVESIKVETVEGLTGWVKPTDIGEKEVEGAKEAVPVNVEEESKPENELTHTAKPGTVIYNQPTYMEDSEVTSTVFKETDVKVVDKVEDTGVLGTFYKVYTNSGKEGYIEVNEANNDVERKVVSKEEVVMDVRLKEPKVLVSQPNGVVGSRDMGIVGTDAVLKSTEKAIAEDTKGNKTTFYRLTGVDDEFVGYAHEDVVIDLAKVENKDAEEEAKEHENEEDTAKGDLGIDSLNIEGLDLAGLGIDEKEHKVNVEDLKGWSIEENPNPNKVISYNDYVLPSSTVNTQTVEFIKMLAPYSHIVKENGLYPSVMIAQAILESDSGQSGLARNSLNLFGVKGSFNGQSTQYNTQEASSGGQFYGTRAGFRDYPTLEAGIRDYAKLLTNSNYTRHGAVNAPSAFHSLTALKEAGYATDPLYVPKVWRVIDTYDLTQFD